MTETWDLWFPHAAATGLPFCRSRVDSTAAGDRGRGGGGGGGGRAATACWCTPLRPCST
jgi:hypothetical protein